MTVATHPAAVVRRARRAPGTASTCRCRARDGAPSARGERAPRPSGELGLPADHPLGRWAAATHPVQAPGSPRRAGGRAGPRGASAAVSYQRTRCAGARAERRCISYGGHRARWWARRDQPLPLLPRRSTATWRARSRPLRGSGSNSRRGQVGRRSAGVLGGEPLPPRGGGATAPPRPGAHTNATSVSTPRPEQRHPPPASRTACSEPSAWRAKWAALRRLPHLPRGTGAATAPRRPGRAPAGARRRAPAGPPARRRGGWATPRRRRRRGPTVTVSPAEERDAHRSSATSNKDVSVVAGEGEHVNPDGSGSGQRDDEEAASPRAHRGRCTPRPATGRPGRGGGAGATCPRRRADQRQRHDDEPMAGASSSAATTNAP